MYAWTAKKFGTPFAIRVIVDGNGEMPPSLGMYQIGYPPVWTRAISDRQILVCRQEE
jgi:hypothetical protein